MKKQAEYHPLFLIRVRFSNAPELVPHQQEFDEILTAFSLRSNTVATVHNMIHLGLVTGTNADLCSQGQR